MTQRVFGNLLAASAERQGATSADIVFFLQCQMLLTPLTPGDDFTWNTYSDEAGLVDTLHATYTKGGDDGKYDVTLDVPEAFIVGATGTVTESRVEAGRRIERHVVRVEGVEADRGACRRLKRADGREQDCGVELHRWRRGARRRGPG